MSSGFATFFSKTNKKLIFKHFVITGEFFFQYLLFTLLYLTLVIFLLLPNQFEKYAYAVGDIARTDITVEESFEYVDKEETEKNAQLIRTKIPPVFDYDPAKVLLRRKETEVEFDSIQRLVSTDSQLKQLISEMESSLNNQAIKSASELRKELENNTNFNKIVTLVPFILKDRQVIEFFDLIKKKQLLDIFLYIYDISSKKYIIESDKVDLSEFVVSGITILSGSNGNQKENNITIDKIYTHDKILKELPDLIKRSYTKLLPFQSEILAYLVIEHIQPNIFVNIKKTEERVNAAIEQEAKVVKKLKKDQIIVRKGDEITKDILKKIQALDVLQPKINISVIIGIAIFTLLLLIASVLFIGIFNKKILQRKKDIILLAVTTTVFVFWTYIASLIKESPDDFIFALFIPVSLFIICLTILYDQHIGAIFSIIYAFLVLIFTNFKINAFIFCLFSGLVSVLSIAKVKNRIDLLVAGLIISLSNCVSVFVLALMQNYVFKEIYMLFAIAMTNGVLSAILAIGILPFLEWALNAVTIFRLMELSDLNSPLLKELSLQAPGTYHHSIQVANLAESAATTIGANTLIARVGAYYHDIGKINQPEYFIENLRPNEMNKHNELKPSMSVSIIKSHIKIGLERAKRLRLPDVIVDIIAQHHGRSLIKFFYHQALEGIDHDKENINKSDFHYTNEIPKSPESAIVLLADSVEAASRTLQTPSASRIEKFVSDLIQDKFKSGDLDESGLTLKDLTKIKDTFVRILTGIFHTRVDYPKEKEIKKIENKIINKK